MANPPYRSNVMKNGSETVTTQGDTRNDDPPFVAYNSWNPTWQSDAEGGAHREVSPKSKPEEDSSGNDATDSESASESDEETIISDEIQEDNLALQLAPGPEPISPGSEKPALSVLNSHDEDSATTVPPALLGEIRKMIQEEFGLLKTIVGGDEPKPESLQAKEEVPRPPPSPRPDLRIDTQFRPLPPAGPPTHENARLSPVSPSADRARLETSMSMGATPTSPERLILVRFAEEGQPAAIGRSDRQTPSIRSGAQLSTIDEKWGRLFDDRGHATQRLDQVLRGLANYIINEFMPQKSLVILPEKMAAFYSLYRLESEVYPFIAIFRSRSKGWSVGLEDIYQDLGCEYYLVPRDSKSRPSVPALTPSGFAKWMTTSIAAYPDAEATRLNHILSELPISADGPWDGITQRLPRQVSRHLLPDKPERKTRRLLGDVVRDFVEEFLPPIPKQGPTRDQMPRIEIVSERRLSASSASTTSTSPRTTKYMPEPRDRRNSTSSPKSSPPTRLGRAYTDDPTRLSLPSAVRNDSDGKLPSPPLGRSSGPFRRRSSPVDPYRRSVGELARANSPVPVSPMVEGARERDEEHAQYVPSRGDYTPKSVDDKSTPRRVAVAQEGVVHPGPTWDEYLSVRQTASARGGMFAARGHKASV